MQDHFSTALSRLQPDESAAQQEQQRGGPIQPSDEGIVSNVGLRLGLAGYDATVDDVIRLLCHLCRKFRPDKPEQDWKADLQLLRVVGAPGIGKSTLLRHVWGLLRQRLAFVKTDQQQHSQQKWQQWEKLGVEQLQQRIEVWGSTPWVFVLDLSGGCQASQTSRQAGLLQSDVWACCLLARTTPCVASKNDLPASTR